MPPPKGRHFCRYEDETWFSCVQLQTLHNRLNFQFFIMLLTLYDIMIEETGSVCLLLVIYDGSKSLFDNSFQRWQYNIYLSWVLISHIQYYFTPAYH